jgi:excinuclease UvrABC nuclease subunit
MVEVWLSIAGDLYDWKEENAKNIPEKPGVYALFDAEKNLIYIGSSSNLRERFTGYWNTNFEEDTCKRATKYYKRELTESYESREKELLEEYKKFHNGKLPKCNEVLP